MEHKLIQGGEQFLPFARSRIKALRAAGLSYAGQKFEIDGVSIEVRIAGEHDHIRLSGDGTLNVLSGVTKDASVVDLPIVPPATAAVKTLRSFKPTREAWINQQKRNPDKSPTVFGDENRFGFNTSQYGPTAPISGSMFSGLMAKAVQLLLGVGKTARMPLGLEIKYDYSWSRTHIVVTATDKKLWLVEISATNGVIAMPFEVQKGGSPASKQKMVREAHKWFKGLPTGATFPTTTPAINEAIANGSVIRLATPSSLAAFHSKSPYAPWVGWTTNNAGSEAHNVCWDSIGGNTKSYHYKISIAIGDTVSPREVDQPLAEGSAVLSLESSDVVWEFTRVTPITTDYLWPRPYGFTDPITGVCQTIPAGKPTLGGSWSQPDGFPIPSIKFPIFVCFINDVLDVVYIRNEPQVFTSRVDVDGFGTDAFNVPGYFVDSIGFPGAPSTTAISHYVGDTTDYRVFTSATATGSIASNLTSSVMFPGAARNAYLHFKAGDYSNLGYAPGVPGTESFTEPVISFLTTSGQKHTQSQVGWTATYRTGTRNWNSEWDIGDYCWCNPSFSFGLGYALCSVFGDSDTDIFSGGAAADTHAVFQRSAAPSGLTIPPPATEGYVLKGAEFAGEPSLSTHRYNFTGYV